MNEEGNQPPTIKTYIGGWDKCWVCDSCEADVTRLKRAWLHQEPECCPSCGYYGPLGIPGLLSFADPGSRRPYINEPASIWNKALILFNVIKVHYDYRLVKNDKGK